MAASEKDLNAIRRARSLSNIPWCKAYEEMISGMAFRPWESTTLAGGRLRAAKICKDFNSNGSGEEGKRNVDDMEKSEVNLQDLFGAFGESSQIDSPFSVLYGCNTMIGKNFYGNVNLAIDDSAFVSIGDDVLIGPDVHFITINHPTDVAERLRGVMFARPITIGNACWIGARATILPGATIGYGCTIGAGAVVSGHIPEYSVAVGVPARVVKHCAEDKTVGA